MRAKTLNSPHRPSNVDNYDFAISVVLESIEFIEGLSADPVTDTKINDAINAVRGARYEVALDIAQQYYKDRYKSTKPDEPELLVDKVLDLILSPQEPR